MMNLFTDVYGEDVNEHHKLSTITVRHKFK